MAIFAGGQAAVAAYYGGLSVDRIYLGTDLVAEFSQPFGFTSGFTLEFEDQFVGEALNTEVWNYRETQSVAYHSHQQPENVTVQDSLRIAKRKEAAGDKEYTGGGVVSKTAWDYGFFEARIKLGAALGWHPAFWTYCSGGPTFTHLDCTSLSEIEPRLSEIDIMEHDDWFNDSVVDQGYTAGIHTVPEVAIPFELFPGENLTGAFHIYGCWHSAGRVRFYLDGALVRDLSYEGDPGIHHIWLSCISTTNRTIVDEDLPDEMVVDWVRVWRETEPALGDAVAVAFDAWAVGINETAPAYDVLSLCTFEGAKGSVSVEFIQPGGGHGTWAVNGSNDFVFTAGSTPSTQSPPAGSIHDPAATPSDSSKAQYRINDGNGWSEYKGLYIEVISVPAGTRFIVENQAGTNDVARINNARAAAVSAGGGVVTTNRVGRFWPTFWFNEATSAWVEIAPDASDSLYFLLDRVTSGDDVIFWYPLVHFHRLPVRCVVPVYVSGNICSSGSYSPAGFPGYWTRFFSTINGPNFNTDAADAVRHNFSLVTFNGKARERPLWQTSENEFGSSCLTSQSQCGTLWPGNRSNCTQYNWQQAPMMYLKGPTSGDRRFRSKIHRSYFHHHASADAISMFQRADLEVINVSTLACGRGGLVVNEGTGKLRAWGLRDRVGVFPDTDGGSGIDLEAFDALNDANPKRVDVEVKNMSTESEFDMILDQGSAVVFDGVEQLRGGQYMIASGSTSITVRNFTLRYWRDDAGFNRPLQMGAGCSATFEDGLFIADGTMFYENTKVFFPTAGDWYLPLRLTGTTAITYLRCTWSSNNLPGGTNTLRCARNRVADTAGLTLTLDNVTIPAGFEQACFILNGGTVRHRNVVHQGGGTIQQIAPGASSYVAL